MSAYLEEFLEFLPEVEGGSGGGTVYEDGGRHLAETEGDALTRILSAVWKEGDRNALALAVAGALVKAGIAEPCAVSLIQRVCSGVDTEPRNRIQAVKDTYRNAKLGRPIKAWTELREHLSESGIKLFAAALGGGVEIAASDAADAYNVPFRLTERRDFPESPMLIEGLLPSDPRGQVCYLTGLSQSFKSYLALDWAGHISQGKTWHGHDVTPGQVLYVAAEGAYRDILSRLRAWEAHNRAKAENVFCRLSPLNILVPEIVESSIKLFSGMEGFKPRLVILDTLSQCAGSADENSSKDARAIYANAKKFGEAFGSTVLIVCHKGKSEGNIMRGSSALFDDSDAVIEMVRPGWQSGAMDCTLSLRKIKSGKLILGHQMMAREVEWTDGGRRGTDLVLIQMVVESAFRNTPKLFKEE